jgi:ABC-type antimicrobial peptide transport system permease subunit
MGVLVVAITLIGLVSALTMNVIERTREIGILRCLGARGRDVRRVFSAEGVTLATLGWVVGIPVGWLISRGLIAFIRHEFSAELTPAFPALSLPVALAAVLVVTLLVIRKPLQARGAPRRRGLAGFDDDELAPIRPLSSWRSRWQWNM